MYHFKSFYHEEITTSLSLSLSLSLWFTGIANEFKTLRFSDHLIEIHAKQSKMADGHAIEEFRFTCKANGQYAIHALRKTMNTEKSLAGECYLDGALVGSFNKDKSGADYGFIEVTDGGKITISQGQHTLQFRTKLPHVPDIDLFRLNMTQSQIGAFDQKYNDYITQLSHSRLPADYAEYKSYLQKNDVYMPYSEYKSKQFKTGRLNYDTDFEFDYYLNHDVKYTFYKSYYLMEGSTYTFETKDANNNSYDPIMFLFSSDMVESTLNDDGGTNYHSKITFTPNNTGYYIVLLISYGSGDGVVDLYKDGTLDVEDAPIIGNKYYQYLAGSYPNENLNYFTAKSTSGTDTRIWIQSRHPYDYANGTGPIITYNDDFSGSDFNWGYHSRVIDNFQDEMAITTIVSAYSPYSTGSCEVYMNVQEEGSSDNLSLSLTHVDGLHFCSNWGMGTIDAYWDDETDNHDYPPSLTRNLACETINDMRYVGAPIFELHDEMSSSDVIIFGGDYLNIVRWAHSYVKGGYDIPYGFSWTEMNPSEHISMVPPPNPPDPDKGHYQAYYRFTGECAYLDENDDMVHASCGSLSLKSSNSINGPLTLQQSMDEGFTCIDRDSIQQGDIDLVNELTYPKDKAFIKVYDNLIEDYINKQIGNKDYYKSSEFDKLFKLGNTNKELALFGIVKYFNKDTAYLFSDLIYQLAYDEYPELQDILESDHYVKEGCLYIQPHFTLYVRYLRAIINKISKTKSYNKNQSVLSSNNFKLSPNPAQNMLNLHSRGVGVGSIIDLFIVTPLGGKVYQEKYTHENHNQVKNINISSLPPGNYIVMLNCNGENFTFNFMKN